MTYILREYGERRRWDTMLLETADGRASPVFKSFVTLLSPTSTDCQGITTPVGIYVPDTVWGQQLERTLAHQTDPQSANWRKGFLHVPINSFNEWHEGTAFEPMMSYRDLSRSQRPLYHNTTNGSYRLSDAEKSAGAGAVTCARLACGAQWTPSALIVVLSRLRGEMVQPVAAHGRDAEYCILNKQYTESEFNNLRSQIVEHMKKTGEWGSFFPPKVSDFTYNETSAHDYFPLSKEEALAQGYQWKDQEQKIPQAPTVQVSDNISDVPSTLIKETLQCESCKKNYKILTQELNFFIKAGIAIPHPCESCRHTKRMQMRNPRLLWARNCQKCGINLESSYAPDRKETILCEKCYLVGFA